MRDHRLDPYAWDRINWLMALWFGWMLPFVGVPALFAYVLGPRRHVRAVLRADPAIRQGARTLGGR